MGPPGVVFASKICHFILGYWAKQELPKLVLEHTRTHVHPYLPFDSATVVFSMVHLVHVSSLTTI